MQGILKTLVIGEELNLGGDDTKRIVRYLDAKGLLKVHGASGTIAQMTTRGIDEVERARTQPDQPTQNFPPFNIIMVERMTDSQILQASPGAAQMVYIEGNKQALLDLTQSIRDHREELAAQSEQQRDLLAEVKTVEAQLRSSKPSPTIIGESLRSMKSILERVAAGVVVKALLNRIDTLLS